MRLLIGLPLLLLLVLFALSNRAPVHAWAVADGLRLGTCRCRWRCWARMAIAFLAGGSSGLALGAGTAASRAAAEQAVRLLEAQVRELKARLPQLPSAMSVQGEDLRHQRSRGVRYGHRSRRRLDRLRFLPAVAALSSRRAGRGAVGALAGGPPRVGLFVDPTAGGDRGDARAVRLDILQLYGAVDLPALRRALRPADLARRSAIASG